MPRNQVLDKPVEFEYFWHAAIGQVFCWDILIFFIQHSKIKRILDSSGAKSEVGGGNGAERSPRPGIQAQRPSPSHRTRDTTDQWRDRFLCLGRSEAVFFPHLGCHEMSPRVAGESLPSFGSFK